MKKTFHAIIVAIMLAQPLLAQTTTPSKANGATDPSPPGKIDWCDSWPDECKTYKEKLRAAKSAAAGRTDALNRSAEENAEHVRGNIGYPPQKN